MFNFDNSYLQLPSELFSKQAPTAVIHPELLVFNTQLAAELGLADLSHEQAQAIFSGNQLVNGSEPIAQAYAGHQFGHATMLGDGRAVLLGEQMTPTGLRVDIQLKGAGRTRYSRRGDGRAAVAPMLREYIISESLHALGVPSTRTLAVVKTGETVYRERPLPGAIAARVASSHIRVGTFQYAAWHENKALLPALFNYAATRHYPEVLQSANPALAFLAAVMDAQIKLVVEWMRVGFIHGVLNTDNVAISGEAIDFGPCAFMDSYNPSTVFSSIDRDGRYAFNQQPSITLWNLSRLAEALLTLIADEEKTAIELANALLDKFSPRFNQQWQQMLRGKLGLVGEQPEDIELIQDWLQLLHQQQLDYTNAHRQMMAFELPEEQQWQELGLQLWHQRWLNRIGENREASLALMQQHNPMVIPRNHLVEQALNSAQDDNNMQPFNKLMSVLQHPYNERPLTDKYCQPAQAHERVAQTFCGT